MPNARNTLYSILVFSLTKSIWIIFLGSLALSIIIFLWLTSNIQSTNHLDNISEDILMAAIATSITVYIFMFETNRRLQARHPNHIEAISTFETAVKRLIVQTLGISILFIITDVLIPSNGGILSSIYLDSLLFPTSIMMMGSNLAATSSIILSRSVISYMSMNGPKGAKSKYLELEFGYCYHRPTLFFLVQDSIVNNQGRSPKYRDTLNAKNTFFDTIHVVSRFKELTKAVEPDDTIIRRLMDKKMYSERDTLQVCRALVQGRKRVEQRLVQYTMMFDDPQINQVITDTCHPSEDHSRNPEDYLKRIDIISTILPSFSIEGLDPKVDKSDIECIGQLLELHKFTHRPELIILRDSPKAMGNEHYVDFDLSEERIIREVSLKRIWRNNYLAILYILYDYYARYLEMRDNKRRSSGRIVKDREMESFEGNRPCSDSILFQLVEGYLDISAIAGMIDSAHHFNTRRMRETCTSEFRCLSYMFYHTLLKKFFFNKPLSNLDLSGVDLSNASFYGSNMEKCDFTSSIISGSDFTECNLRNCTWINVRTNPGGVLFTSADFTGSVFGRINIDHHSDLCDAIFAQSVMDRSRFKEVDMRGITMDSMSLSHCQFRGAMMDVSTFKNTTLDRCTFVPERPLDMEMMFEDGDSTIEYIEGRIEIRLNGAMFNGFGNDNDRTLWSNRMDDLYSGIISDCRCLFRNLAEDTEDRCYYLITLSRTLKEQYEYTLSLDRVYIKDMEEARYQKYQKSSGLALLDIHILDHPKKERVVKGCDMEGSKFIGSDLTNSLISSSNMRNCLFSDGSLLGTTMSKVILDESTFIRYEIRNTITVRGRFFHCSFNSTHWDTCQISETEFWSSDFKMISMRKMSILNSEFRDCPLGGAMISDSTIEDTIINISNPSDDETNMASFEECQLIRVRLILPKKMTVVFRNCMVDGYFSVERNGSTYTIPCEFHHELRFG